MIAKEEIAILASGFARFDELRTKADIATQGQRAWFRVEKSVGARFDLKAVVAQRPGRAARSIGLLENGDVGIGQTFLQSECDRQAGDAGADDHDTWRGWHGMRLEWRAEPREGPGEYAPIHAD